MPKRSRDSHEERFYRKLAAQEPLDEEAERRATPQQLASSQGRLALMLAHRWRYAIEFDEAVSLALLGIVKASRLYDPAKGRFLPFAWSCAATELHNAVRDCRRGACEALPEDDDQLPDPRVTPPDQAAEDREEVERLLETLTARQREVMELYYFSERSGPKIAADLGISEARAHELIATAHHRLRQIVIKERNTQN